MSANQATRVPPTEPRDEEPLPVAQPMPTSSDPAVALAELVVDPEPARVISSRVGRVVYMLLGFLSLGLGIAGYIVPLLPGTVFLLMATYFFFRSSERMYNWMVNHPRFGMLIRNYRAGFGIPRRVKVYAITLLVVSFAITITFTVSSSPARGILVATALAVIVFIVTRPTTEVVLAEA